MPQRIHDQWNEALRNALTGSLGQSDPEAFLRQSARCHVGQQAAGKLSLETEVPGEEPQNAGETQACKLPGVRAGNLLANLMKRPTSRLLQEWLEIAGRQNFRAPAEHLPALLDLATEKADLKLPILPLLEGRGEWLCAQRAKWRSLSRKHYQGWENAQPGDQLKIYRTAKTLGWRDITAPMEARWNSLPADSRLRYLTVLEEVRRPDDQALIEHALNDASLKVARKAAQMLRGPSGPVGERARELLEPWVKERNRKPELPTNLPKRDPLVLCAHSFPHALPEAQRLFATALCAVTPGYWGEPGEYAALIKWAQTVPLGNVWLIGWLVSAREQQNARFLEAVLRLLYLDRAEPAQRKRLHEPTLETRALTFSHETFQDDGIRQIFCALLSNLPSPLHDRHPVFELLCLNAETRVPEEVGVAILAQIRRHIAEGWAGRLEGWNMAHYLKQLAYTISPVAHPPEAASSWPESSPDWPKWHSAVDQFERVVHTRRVMHRALGV